MILKNEWNSPKYYVKFSLKLYDILSKLTWNSLKKSHDTLLKVAWKFLKNFWEGKLQIFKVSYSDTTKFHYKQSIFTL